MISDSSLGTQGGSLISWENILNQIICMLLPAMPIWFLGGSQSSLEGLWDEVFAANGWSLLRTEPQDI